MRIGLLRRDTTTLSCRIGATHAGHTCRTIIFFGVSYSRTVLLLRQGPQVSCFWIGWIKLIVRGVVTQLLLRGQPDLLRRQAGAPAVPPFLDLRLVIIPVYPLAKGVWHAQENIVSHLEEFGVHVQPLEPHPVPTPPGQIHLLSLPLPRVASVRAPPRERSLKRVVPPHGLLEAGVVVIRRFFSGYESKL